MLWSFRTDCCGSDLVTQYIPLEQFKNPAHFKVATTELFGPFFVVSDYKDQEIDQITDIIDKMENHLTAGVVSNDVNFLNYVLGNTINGVTYAGIKGRTTGAPQNHWFGPAGDPRAAGIGTPEAVLTTWTGHREVILDYGPISKEWKTPAAS